MSNAASRSISLDVPKIQPSCPLLAHHRRGGLLHLMALTTLLSSAVAWSQPVPPAGTPIITTVAGSGLSQYYGDGHAATAAGLNYPNGVAVDSAGNLYIADTSNYVVRKVTPLGIISTVAGTGTTGSSGNEGPATSAKLILPRAVAVDNSGNLFIADDIVIRKVTPDGIIHLFTGQTPPGSACPGNICSPPSRAGGTALTVDVSGNLYVADPYDQVVLKVTRDGYISVVAGNGTTGYSGDGGLATNAALSYPEGVALDAAGNLYISDSYNRVVRKVSTTGIITTFAGNGVPGYSGDGGPVTNAQFLLPYALGFDPAGSLYISDVGNSVVRKVTNGIISTIAGDGTFGYSGDGGAATSAQLNYPYGVALDASGNLYIADDLNQRIRKVGAVPPLLLDPLPGVYPSAQSVSIQSTLPGTTIYYTTDGTTPSTLSSVYSGPIAVSSTATIEAIAVAGSTQSVVSIGRYVIGQQLISTVAGNGSVGSGGDGGQAVNTPLNLPFGVAVDPLGNLYIADSFNSVVRKVTPGGIISLVAGNYSQGSSGDGGPATNAQLRDPYGVAVDAAGNVYIADSSNNVVREVKLDGTISAVAGNYIGGYSGDSGVATSAQLNSPYGVVVDASGNLYIADTLNNRVRKVDPGGTITTVAGNGTTGYSGDGGAAIASPLNLPTSVALDLTGTLYVADHLNSAIRKVTPEGTITTVAGNGTPGYSGDGGAAASAQLKYPEGVAVDVFGNILVVDDNDVIRAVSSTGIITTVAGTGVAGYSGDGGPATSAQIFHAKGIAADASGTFYIADTSNNRIRRVGVNPVAAAPEFSPTSGTYASAQTVTITDATPGATIYYTTDGTTPTTSSDVYSGTISVTASETIQAIAVASGYSQSAIATANYTITGLPTPAIYWPNPASITEGTALSATQLNASSPVVGTFVYTPAAGTVPGVGYQPLRVVFTPADPVSYTTATAMVTLLVTPNPTSGPNIATVVGNGNVGYSGDGGPALSAQLHNPTAMATDVAGNLFFADYLNHVIRKVDSSGSITTVAGNGTAGYSGDGGPATSAQLSDPLSLAMDASGNIYISDVFNNVIRKVTPGGTISTVAGNGTFGYSGDGGQATSAQLDTPQGVAVDASGNLYIADYASHVVRKVTPAGIISTVAGNNTPGNSGDGGPAANAQLTSPLSLAVDLNGNLYIADIAIIRKVTPQGIISTLAGNGTFGYSGDGGPAINAQLGDPYGIAADANGNLYIADFENNVIRQVTPDGTITRVAGTGVPGFSGDGGPATSAQVYYPRGVAIDAAGNLYIADTSNQRIRKVGQATLVSTSTPSFNPPAGTYTSAQTVTISASTAGATIYYTTDGSTPTTKSAVYSGAITVAASETIQAIAVANGYAPSAVATASYSINVKASQTISFGAMASVTYGAGPIHLSATATSGLPVSFTATGPATVVGSILSITGKGSVTVIATQPGNASFAPAPAVSQSFTVLAKSLTVTANNLSRSVGTANPELTVSYSGFVNGETASILSGAPVLSTTATSASAAGVYPISIAHGTLAAANYAFTFVNGTLSVVAPTPVAITAASTLTKVSSGYQASIKVTNIGTANASNVQLTTAFLGVAPGSPLPLSLGSLAAGGAVTVNVIFPASAGNSGSTAIEKLTGTYTGGTFTVSLRAKLP